MIEYKAIYKCRFCQKSFKDAITGNKDLAEKVLMSVCYDIPINEPQSPTMYRPHYCENGSMGVADFIGWEKEETPEHEYFTGDLPF